MFISQIILEPTAWTIGIRKLKTTYKQNQQHKQIRKCLLVI